MIAKYDVEYERHFPTWMFLGFPLAVRADLDTDVQIVERTDVDTKHCFTYCDVATGEPVGFELNDASDGDTNWKVRTRTAYGCNAEKLKDAGKLGDPAQAAEFAFQDEACSVKVQIRYVSGAGDSLEEKGVSDDELSVGVWDPRGVTVLDGIRSDERRRLEEDPDGLLGVRGHRYLELLQDPEGDTEELNAFTQSPRGTMAIAVGANAVSGIRAYLAALEDLPGDLATSAAGRPIAAASTLLLVGAAVLGLARNTRGWLMVSVLVAIPLATATHALCGCARRAEVVISVPRGFSFSRFEFSGSGRVACSNCDGAESGDYSTTTAPYTEQPVAPTPVDPAFSSVGKAKYFDPRYLLARPLKFEVSAATHVLIQSHGVDEIEHCHPTDQPPADAETNQVSEFSNSATYDGETALHVSDETGHAVRSKSPVGCSRSSYVKAQGHIKPSSSAKVNFLPTAEAFTVQVGASVVVSSGAHPRARGPQLSAGVVVAMLATTMHRNLGSRWAMIALLSGATAVWAQQESSDVVVVLDMPRGLCFSEVDLGELSSQVTCPGCAAWTCPTKPGSDPPGSTNVDSAAAAASEQTWMSHLKTMWTEFEPLEKGAPCAAGGVDARIYTRGMHDDEPPDASAGFVRLAPGHTVGCRPCEAGTWMHTQGGACKPCNYPDRCEGGNGCLYNFTGTECGVCTPNFYQEEEDDDHPDGSCEACPEATTLGYVLFVFGLVCSVMVFVLMTIKGTAAVRGQPSVGDAMVEIQEEVEEAVAMLKQTLTYLQAIVLLCGAKQFTTPEWMTQLKQKVSSIAFVNIAGLLDMKLPSDCVVEASPDTSLEDLYWRRFGAIQWLFWAVLFVCMVLSLIFDRLHYEKTRPLLPGFLGTATSTPIAVAGTMYSTLYITLLSSAARTFDCTTDDAGVSRLDDFPDVICWEGRAVMFQLLGLACTCFFIGVWVTVANKQISNFEKFSGGDGELDTEELRRMHASHSERNLELVDKDGDGIISKKEMAELDALKAKAEAKEAAAAGEGAADAAVVAEVPKASREVVLSQHDLKVETAEYGKKTVLVLVVVFLSDWPWLSWTIMVVSYSSYFVVKQGSLEASDPGDEDMTSEGLAHLSESAQLVGEFMLVLLSAYFISVTDEDDYAWGYWVVTLPIMFTNGVASLCTLLYTVQFWIGVYGRCMEIKTKVVGAVIAAVEVAPDPVVPPDSAAAAAAAELPPMVSPPGSLPPIKLPNMPPRQQQVDDMLEAHAEEKEEGSNAAATPLLPGSAPAEP